MKGGLAEGHIPTPRPRGQHMCYAWGEGGSAFEKKNFFFIFEHFSQKKWKKNTRAHQWWRL